MSDNATRDDEGKIRLVPEKNGGHARDGIRQRGTRRTSEEGGEGERGDEEREGSKRGGWQVPHLSVLGSNQRGRDSRRWV